MKRVEPAITKEEYLNKVEAPLKEELLKSINSCKEEVEKRLKSVSKTWFIALALGLILFGVFFVVLSLFTGLPLLFGVVIGIIAIIAGTIMFIYRYYRFKGIDELYREKMDLKKVYAIAIGGLPGFKFEKAENVISRELQEYTYKIPSDAFVESSSELFTVTYKEKYQLFFQAALYHWITYSRDSEGNTTKNHHYRNSGFAIMETNKEDDDHSFTMHRKNWISNIDIDKIKLENKEFLKSTKFKSDNEIKARMMCTPLAMEEILKTQRRNNISFDLVKVGGQARFTFASMKNHFIVDAKVGKTPQETAKRYLNDIVEDFFSMYLIITPIIIPPML